MSRVTVSGNALGTGTFTIASPNSNTDRTLNLPDSAGTLATSESTLAQFNASGSAPVYAARAWVNFNGTGTVAIRAAGNVSSITDNGVGDYTVNFATAMPDINFCPQITVRQDTAGTFDGTPDGQVGRFAFTTTTVSVNCFESTVGGALDFDGVFVAVFR